MHLLTSNGAEGSLASFSASVSTAKPMPSPSGAPQMLGGGVALALPAEGSAASALGAAAQVVGFAGSCHPFALSVPGAI
jgi:hypothetical protein